MLLWGEPAQGHVRAVVLAGPHPLRGKILNFFEAGPVILRRPFITHCPVEAFDVNVLLRLRRIHLDGQTLTVEIINAIEQADASPDFQFVEHVGHQANLIDRLWHHQRIWFLTDKACSQIRLQLTIVAINPFVMPSQVIHMAQTQLAQAKAPS